MERPLGSKYVLETALGRGATGEVWRGRSTEGVALAFKVLHDTLARDPETVRRFVQEGAILVKLVHPNLVHVRDLVAEGETLAIVMDLVDGRDLRSVLTEYGTVAPAEACRLAADATAGLVAVHEAGIVHRDIKPENVLLDLSEQPPRVRLTDFGIAKIAEQSGSGRSTLLVGTPQYIAPEVFDGHTPTPASDLYALGIMLYELCCGVTPFAGGSTLQILRRHVDNAPGRPAGIPDPLWELIAQLLAKDPGERPPQTAALMNQLTVLAHDLADEPAVPALPEPPPSIPLVHDQLTDRVDLPKPQAGLPTGTSEGSPAGPAHVRSRRRGWKVVGALLVTLVLAAGATGGAWWVVKRKAGTALAAGSATPATPNTPKGVDPPTPSASQARPTYAPGQLPDLVGMSLDQVKALLPTTVSVQTDLNNAPAGTPDGVVLTQDPAPGTAMPPSVHLSVASSRAVAYLADMTPTSGQLDPPSDGRPYSLSGSTQLHALGTGIACDSGDSSIEYDLGSHYDKLIGLAGVDDASADAKAKVTVEFFGDQRKLASISTTLGKPAQLNVTVTGVLRLSIRWSASVTSCDKNATFVLGNVQLMAAQGFLPTPTPSGSDAPSDTGGTGQ